jgi:hypothetical protein
MRLALALLLLLLPQLAHAEWAKTLDTECRCDHAFPIKPSDSTRPSPWPNVVWHRSEAKRSATEWYAVSWAAFDKVPPANAFTASIAQLVDHVTKPAMFAIALDVSRAGNTTPTISGLDGDPQKCTSYLFTDAPIGRPLDDNPAKLVIDASYKPPAKR